VNVWPEFGPPTGVPGWRQLTLYRFADYPDGLQLDFPSNKIDQQSAILDNSESEALDAFFSNPDNPKASTSVFGLFHSGGVGGTMGMSGVNSNFHAIPASTEKSASIMVGKKAGDIKTVSPASAMPRPIHTPNFMNTNSAHENADVMSGAHALSSMAGGQDQEQRPNIFGGAWGDMSFNIQPNAMESSASSSRHSSTANVIPLQFMSSSAYQMQHQQALAHWQQQQQQQQAGGNSHARQQSLDMNTFSNPFNLLAPHPSFSYPQPARPDLIHYGSDPNIRAHGYIAPGYASYMHEKGGNLNNVPLADQVASKGIHVETSSPHVGHLSQRSYFVGVMPGATPGVSHQTPSNTGMSGLPLGLRPQDHDEADPRPNKRRKSEFEREADAEYNPGMTSGQIPKRGPKVPKAEPVDDDAYMTPLSNNKRRRSTFAGPSTSNSPTYPGEADSPSADVSGSNSKRPPGKARQNLTDAEKRQNHILSEQKRRNVIKNGYSDLETLVPALHGGKSGLSKADALRETISFLEKTICGNEAMMERLKLNSAGAAGGIGGY